MRTQSHEPDATLDAPENPPSSVRRKPHRLRLVLIAVLSLLIIITVAVVFLIRSWPFTRDAVAQAIQEDLSGTVQMREFRSTFFPHPGCVIDDVTFHRNDQDSLPLVTIKRLVIQGTFSSLFGISKKIKQKRVEGSCLHARPFRFNPRPGGQANAASKHSQFVIGE